MKPEPKPSGGRGPGKGNPRAQPSPAAQGPTRRLEAADYFSLTFGLFLGLALVKFGNPVILESKITPPRLWIEFLVYPWPLGWGVWLLIPLAVVGLGLVAIKRPRWPATRWLWILPCVWLGWQVLSGTQTVDKGLTLSTLPHFAGCVACFLTGALVLGEERRFKLLLIGLIAAFAFCLVRAADQRLAEFPQERRMLVEGERTGWTNLPPEIFLEMKRDGVIITTNGVDVANPVILAKYGKEPPPNMDAVHRRLYLLFASTPRVNGTLVYPNALAGAILLLFPIAVTLAFWGTREFRVLTRVAAIGLTLFLGVGGLFWSGSKSGWLIALGMGGVYVFRRLNWSVRTKAVLIAAILLGGLLAFGVRFQHYFTSGASSVGARFDYWRAALQTTRAKPLFGSGPGTFQRPYEHIKAPDAEMARLTHNDYLEQFSDSGIIGGISYALWIGLLLVVSGKAAWRLENRLVFASFAGVGGWFIQGLTEFSLYVPALAWTAFALSGALLRLAGNRFDKPRSAG